jgi:origin recognition complex subunit 4
MPTAAKKRTTRSGADAEATPSRNGTGLNGDYWTPTVRGGTTGQVWYASTDENEDSEPELAIVPARTRQPAKPKVDGASPSKALARVSSPTNTNIPVQSSSRFDAHPSVQPMDPSASEDNEPAQLHADGSHFDEPPASEAESFDDDGEDLLPSPPVSPSKRGRKGPNSGKASSSKPFTKSDISSHRQVRPKTKLATSESDEAPLLTPSSLPKTSFPSTSTSVLDNGALPALGQYPASPGKRDVSPSRLPRPLPSHLVAHFRAQKSVVFRVLRDPSVLPVADNHDSKNPDTRQLAAKQLRALLKGTTERGEGNSCMIIGPKGSGKTYVSHD